MYLSTIAQMLRDYQVQVHDAFLVLQPPVSASASLRSLQCACKASAVQTARLNAPSKIESAVIGCLRSMFSASPSLSVQVFTISHHFHTICFFLSCSVHLYMQERHSFALVWEALPVAADIMHFCCHLFPLQRTCNSGSVNESFHC
jgi:hypothetical protein